MKGGQYAVKSFRRLDEQAREAVIEDMKYFCGDADESLMLASPEKYLRQYVVERDMFRTVFYIRCRGRFGACPKLEKLVDACKFFLPANDAVDINTDHIGKGLRVFHPPVGIGEPVVIGDHVTIGPHVVIGKRQGACPIIHDNVQIGAGAIVLGGIEIGEGSIIGAGSVVLSDVPANSVCAGNPARVLREKKAGERLTGTAAGVQG